MATNKHRKKKLKKNITHKTYKKHKRHYRKRRYKNSLREYLVSENHENQSENDKREIISIAPESGNMIQGLREILSNTNTNNDNDNNNNNKKK